MDSDSSFERSGLSDNADAAVIADIDMLDFYLDVNSSIGDSPLLIRIGRQVINWGEATFILGGNSTFNSIDVGAIRRPGAEIKEALLPIEAVYGSLALTENLTLEAYYGGWDNYKIDNGGTPFANSDSFEATSAGNGARSYVGAGAFTGSGKRNCTDPASITNVATRHYATTTNEVFGTCETDSILHFNVANQAGFVERSRQSIANTVVAGRDEAGYTLGDTDFLARGKDEEPDRSDNYGLALRWYAENLNSTEFGFYYQRYASRIPYASSIARQPLAGPNVTTPTSSFTTRGLALTGCAAAFAVANGTALAGAASGNPAQQLAAAQNASSFVRTTDNLVKPAHLTEIADPTGLGAHVRDSVFGNQTKRDAIIAAAAPVLKAQLASVASSRTFPAALTGAAAATNNVYTESDNSRLIAALENVVEAAMANPNGTLAQGTELSCIGLLAQADVPAGPLAALGGLTRTGASTIATRYQTEIVAEYPEDIDVYGFSFNTTIGGWGVQGEIAYRPNMPLQLDTDAVAIAAIGASCAWENFNLVGDNFYGSQTIPTKCGQWDEVFNGYVREQVGFLDIGTTATFTRSNPVVDFLGADLGVLLTEIGVIHLPDADHYTQSNEVALAADIPRLASLCTSGSDLPLGGVFALDPRGPLKANNAIDETKPAIMCRPTDTSSGIVLFGQLQYNNAFGTAWGLRPSIAYNRGIEGRSPSPAGSFIEDNESLNLRISAEYQSTWTVSLGYTMFDGEELYNRNVDRDFVSLSTSYAF